MAILGSQGVRCLVGNSLALCVSFSCRLRSVCVLYAQWRRPRSLRTSASCTTRGGSRTLAATRGWPARSPNSRYVFTQRGAQNHRGGIEDIKAGQKMMMVRGATRCVGAEVVIFLKMRTRRTGGLSVNASLNCLVVRCVGCCVAATGGRVAERQGPQEAAEGARVQAATGGIREVRAPLLSVFITL